MSQKAGELQNSEPDLLLGSTGKVADVLSIGTQSSSETAALASAMQKILKGQTQHVIVNLDRSPWTLDQMASAFRSDSIDLFVDTAGTKATYTSLEDAIASRAPGTFYVSDLGVQSGVEQIDLFRRGELRTIFR